MARPVRRTRQTPHITPIAVASRVPATKNTARTSRRWVLGSVDQQQPIPAIAARAAALAGTTTNHIERRATDVAGPVAIPATAVSTRSAPP
jgi:hypothetical protein